MSGACKALCRRPICLLAPLTLGQDHKSRTAGCQHLMAHEHGSLYKQPHLDSLISPIEVDILTNMAQLQEQNVRTTFQRGVSKDCISQGEKLFGIGNIF